ncbi:MAG TPA: TolC family protein, partial [Gammaproteobacteria bacterium]|nr:TolC family protein [Gammaproteobacteria bacterium]
MKKIFITILILLTGFNAQAISEREFIERLKATHPFFEQQALSSQIKQVEKRLTTANEDWVISINGNYKNENASDISSSTYNKLNTTSADVSATRKIANSGSD